MMFRALLLSALFCLGGPKPGDEPTDPFAETREEVQKNIVEQLEPDLPADLLIGEVSVPATFVPGEDDEVRAKWRRVPKEGNAFALVELTRNGIVQRRAFVRVKLIAVHEVLVAQRELAEATSSRRGTSHSSPELERTASRSRPSVSWARPSSRTWSSAS